MAGSEPDAPLAVLASGVIAVHPDASGPVAALRGLDLTVEPGELAAVVGPSGSGKTTFLRLVAGVGRPTAGHLAVHGLDLTTAPDAAVRRHQREVVAIVEQHYRLSLSPYLTIRDSVALPLAVRGVARRERVLRAGALLERVGLGDRGDARPGELSGGEQQRVAVAAALVGRPRLLLADEPTGELDAATAEGLLRLIRELVAETGATAIVVTHDEAVERVADRTIHLRDGRAIAERHGPTLARLVDGVGWMAPPVRDGSTVGTPGLVHDLAEVPHRAVAGSVPGGPASVDPGAEAPGAEASGAASAGVRLVDVSRVYGRDGSAIQALQGVSFELARGGFHVVTGPSGAGKSTILRLVAGLDDPTNGTVETLGQPMAALDRDARAGFRARRLGVVDQGRGLTPFLSALENVSLALTIHGHSEAEARERAQAALATVGLAELVVRRPATLSAGERTRVTIARALATEPELILLDEPTATLDRANAAHVGDLLARLAGPRTIVAATHDRALMDVATDRYSLEAPRG